MENKWINIQKSDVGNYTFEKYVTTAANLKKTLETYGVAIIENVLSKEECKEMENGMWTYFEGISSTWPIPVSRHDPKTWKGILSLLPLHSMLYQHFGIGHAQFAWTLRQNPSIIAIFSELWKVKPEELLVSFDGSSFHIPPEIIGRGRYLGNTWYHTDQRLSNSDLKCVQSFVTAKKVNPGDATLTIFEKSHLHHHEFSEKFGHLESKSDWFKIDSQNEWDFFAVEKGCARVNIACPAGSMVFWDSRTFHAGQESLKERIKPNFRMICYLCYVPRRQATAADLKKKQKAFNESRTTNHYANKPKLFAKTPRTYGHTLPEITLPAKVKLDKLGLKLAGF